MSDKRPYGDDPSRYPPDYLSNPSSSSNSVDPGMSSGYNDPGMSSGYNDPYFGTSTTSDNNPYSGWGSAYPNQPIPTFDNNSYSGNRSVYPNQPIPTFDNNPYQPTAYVDPYSAVPNSAMVATSDHNAYLGNPSGYPSQSDPCSNDEVTTLHPFWDTVHPYTSSDGDSVDSADRNVQSVGLKMCSKKKEREKREYQQWIASWKKGTEPPPEYFPGNFVMDYFVSTDGYFRAGRKGGYGFIIRDNVGKPIVASAVTSTKAVSFLYHQVEGVTRAVELAVKFSLRYIELFCNAKHVARLVNRAVETVSGCRSHSHQKNSVDVICKKCVKRCVESFTKEDYRSVFPLLKRIGELAHEFLVQLRMLKVSRERNKAADYLAKNGAPGMEVLHPCQFPDELKEILCKDYVGCDMYGLPCSI